MYFFFGEKTKRLSEQVHISVANELSRNDLFIQEFFHSHRTTSEIIISVWHRTQKW